MLNAILSRWARSRSASLSTLGRRHAAAPTRSNTGDSLLQSLRRWLPGDADAAIDTAQTRQIAKAREALLVPHLRSEFEACLLDLGAAAELRRSIQRCRRVEDFWHLRGWLYTAVARAHSQHEAELRLARLNRHFNKPPDPFFLGGTRRRQ
jgi:hypothetical protein